MKQRGKTILICIMQKLKYKETLTAFVTWNELTMAFNKVIV
jgi:hypothetical protein